MQAGRMGTTLSYSQKIWMRVEASSAWWSLQTFARASIITKSSLRSSCVCVWGGGGDELAAALHTVAIETYLFEVSVLLNWQNDFMLHKWTIDKRQ